ncbi:Zinc finger, CHCC-type [Dillenia turbinata]|uniref:Zinc finger, CHCC-type n=1 Tax=Dillenia turbinata TaxID=194707 RepID=A0AAN8V3U2_9MAGN
MATFGSRRGMTMASSLFKTLTLSGTSSNIASTSRFLSLVRTEILGSHTAKWMQGDLDWKHCNGKRLRFSNVDEYCISAIVHLPDIQPINWFIGAVVMWPRIVFVDTSKKSPMELINEVPPIVVKGRIVACEGDSNPALGHPIEFICLDLEAPAVCKYCGLRYVQKHDHHH